MNIVLYFGSFNPVHAGHIGLATYIVEHTMADQLWFVVSPNNPLKSKSELADASVRLSMLQLAIADAQKLNSSIGDKLFASDIEFDMPLPSYTINTLLRLKQLYPQHTFSLLIGSDNLTCFHLWKDYERILSEFSLIVYPRKGDDIKALQTRYPMVRVLEGAPLFDISSTQIRQKLRANQDCSEWLSKSVSQFLLVNPVYKL